MSVGDLFAMVASRPPAAGMSGAGILASGFMLVMGLAVFIVGWLIVGFIRSKVFEKAGKPTLAAYIPIWNVIVELDIIGRPWWWIVFIPLSCGLFYIYLMAKLFECFGLESPINWVVALAVFVPGVGGLAWIGALAVIGFGSATYRAPAIS